MIQHHIDTLTAAITRLEEASPADLAPHAEHLNGIKGRLAILQEDAARVAKAGASDLAPAPRTRPLVVRRDATLDRGLPGDRLRAPKRVRYGSGL